MTLDEIAMRLVLATDGKDPTDPQSMSDDEFMTSYSQLQQFIKGTGYTVGDIRPHIREAIQTYRTMIPPT